MGPRKRRPRRCHAGKRGYVRRRHHRHHRVGRTYAHRHNHQRMGYTTVILAIARTLCKLWDAPLECVQIARGCISSRAASRRSSSSSKRGFVHIIKVVYFKTTSIPSLLCTGLYLPPIWFQDLSRICHDTIIPLEWSQRGLYALISSSLCRSCVRVYAHVYVFV